MSKHMAKDDKKAAKHAPTTRPLKVTRGKKPTHVKKAVAQQGRSIGEVGTEGYGLELNAPQLRLVDLEALGKEPESVADVFELFGVEVVSDAEGSGQSDEPELTLADSD